MKKSTMMRAVSWLATVLWAGYAGAQAPPGGVCGSEPQAAFCSAVRGARSEGWPAQSRSEEMAQHGMEVTSQPLAAEAGVQILPRGREAMPIPLPHPPSRTVTPPLKVRLGGGPAHFLLGRHRNETH